jgi:hypothetical protein
MPQAEISWYSRPMDATTGAKKLFRIGFFLSASLALTVALFGCNQSDAQAKKEEVKPAAPEAAHPEKAQAPATLDAVPAGESSYKEESFHLTLTAPEAIEAGKPAEFKVILEAQAGFKVNDEYPIKFQFAEQKGILPSKPIVKKDDAKIEKQRAEMPLSVTIEAKGKHKVSGKLSFSVCTDERCLIEKRDLSVEVNAS